MFVHITPNRYNLSWQVRNVEYQYEGDSLGLAIAVSVIAKLLEQQIPQDIALTGVVTKDGEVIQVGGICEKVKAARKAGIRKIIIPFANKGEIPEELLHESVEPVNTLEEALHAVFPNLYEIYTEPFVRQIQLHLSSIKQEKYLANLYVNRTQIEDEVEHFLHSDKSGLVILGHSGIGKTNLIGHLTEQFLAEKHLVLLYLCSALSEDIERTLEKDLGGENLPLGKSLQKLNQIAVKWQKHVILLFDGINEYNYGEKTSAELLRDLDNFIARYAFPRVKVIITCRSVTWMQLERLRKTELRWERYLARMVKR